MGHPGGNEPPAQLVFKHGWTSPDTDIQKEMDEWGHQNPFQNESLAMPHHPWTVDLGLVPT